MIEVVRVSPPPTPIPPDRIQITLPEDQACLLLLLSRFNLSIPDLVPRHSGALRVLVDDLRNALDMAGVDDKAI